ncbi:hypothetical protein FGG08_002783 [Glutinoglossum americanum]|uniref:Uncharacterized protein n=1 Tax=Glutinoglossum americanum TaxID=1670608 RepID=A0A9P8L467_9PEZI|nr:hypothetical protein FGG08_002783 [Glutinoglossum americanum]
MASTSPLQLFPAPAPKASRPKRKGTRRYPVRTSSSPVVINTAEKSAIHTKEIILHVSSDLGRAGSVKAPPKTHVIDRSHSRADTTSSARSKDPRAASPALTNQYSDLSGSATLVRSNSSASVVAAPPPIKSMFPRYDPSLPLAQQHYHRMDRPSRVRSGESLSVNSPSSPGVMSTISTAPAAMMSFPTGVMGKPKPKYSSLEELAGLWETANGQGAVDAGRTFALRMCRAGTVDPASGSFTPTHSEAFSFGPSRTEPFFDFQTLKENSFDAAYSEVIVRRHDPVKRSIIPVITLDLEPPSRRLPPNDGLITLIYPKIAAMMALDATASRVKYQGVESCDAEALAREAVSKAAEKECCKLLWDSEKERYYLWHPGVNGGKGQSFAIRIDGEIGFDSPRARGTVQLLNPNKEDAPLASLEFSTESLLVDTAGLASIDSFYIVDVAVTAIVTVALVEGRRIRSKRFSAPPSLLNGKVGLPDSIPTFQGQQKKKDAGSTEVPEGAEGLLALIFLAYKMLIWGLGLGVSAVVALVVALTTMLGGKK